MKTARPSLLAVASFSLLSTGCATARVPAESAMSAYLLVYFRDDTHSLHMALSSDGSYGTQPHNFGFCETTDFKTLTPLGKFNEGVMKAVNFTSPKHGSVIPLTAAEARKLAGHWKLDSY